MAHCRDTLLNIVTRTKTTNAYVAKPMHACSQTASSLTLQSHSKALPRSSATWRPCGHLSIACCGTQTFSCTLASLTKQHRRSQPAGAWWARLCSPGSHASICRAARRSLMMQTAATTSCAMMKRGTYRHRRRCCSYSDQAEKTAQLSGEPLPAHNAGVLQGRARWEAENAVHSCICAHLGSSSALGLAEQPS